MSDWISVEKESPPKDGSQFFVYDEHHGFIPFIYFEDGEWISESFQWSGRFKYWQPIPAPPNRSTE